MTQMDSHFFTYLLSPKGGPTWNSDRQLESKLVRRQLNNSA